MALRHRDQSADLVLARMAGLAVTQEEWRMQSDISNEALQSLVYAGETAHPESQWIPNMAKEILSLRARLEEAERERDFAVARLKASEKSRERIFAIAMADQRQRLNLEDARDTAQEVIQMLYCEACSGQGTVKSDTWDEDLKRDACGYCGGTGLRQQARDWLARHATTHSGNRT